MFVQHRLSRRVDLDALPALIIGQKAFFGLKSGFLQDITTIVVIFLASTTSVVVYLIHHHRNYFMEVDYPKPSDAEVEILCILWDHHPASVRIVHEELCKKKKVGYTTTLKQMQRMQEKKMIRRVDNDDRTHEYEAILQRDATRNSLFDRLVETAFQGSAMDMVLHAIGRSTTSPEEIRALKQWLDKIEGKKS